MLTTGTVSLSLAEVDKLRDTIKEKENLSEQLSKEIEKLKADSKQVLITEQELCCGFNEWEVGQVLSRYSNRHFHSPHYKYASEDIVRDLLGAMIPGIHKDKKVYFKNLDDVQKEIRDKLELEYQEELRQAKANVRDLNDKIKEVRDEEQKKSIGIQKELQNQLSDKNEVIDLQDKKYRELVKGKRELSRIEELEAEVQRLYKLYQEERDKKWYHKLKS